jgi:hypothetical protein
MNFSGHFFSSPFVFVFAFQWFVVGLRSFSVTHGLYFLFDFPYQGVRNFRKYFLGLLG